MTLLIQTTEPTCSNCPGVAKSAFCRMPTTSRSVDSAVATVINATISPVVIRSQRLCRSMRPGSPIISTARNVSSITG